MMSDSAALVLDQLEPDVSRLVNAWLAVRQFSEWPVAGRRLRIQWGCVLPHAPFAVAIECTLAGQALLVKFDGLAGIDPRLVGEPFSHLPAPTRNLVIERVAADFSAALPQGFMHDVDIRAVHWTAPDSAAWPCAIGFTVIREDGAQSRGTLAAGVLRTLEWLHQAMPQGALAPLVSRGDMPVAVCLRVGRTVLAKSTVRGLGAGDVVWIDEGGAISRHGVTLVFIPGNSSQRAWSVRLKQRTVTLQAPYSGILAHAQGLVVNRGEQSTMHKDHTDIEVPVVFEMGQMVLPLAEIERLHADQTFELEQDASLATVTLSVFGSVIAQGKLIAIGSKLGVRIVRVAGSGNEQSA
ncbi:hypothetical protein GM658_18650 [Pseudoduganella eburnea]|uniref:Flagellar motor switch protein FliN-like C-terminal domain-containing protein n=1 Tax=Massilia eburnea TaxID=1776165 RepID=A0A6L6QM07_9BURK|nr:FliM/FliN family flagellar motor switch protein [Massilia eburnea]MTW12633.1 hypothetical protein [Massilia eburnea]